MPRPCVKVSWSGGKDSTAAVLLNIAAGYEVKVVCYVPMFDESTPLIMPDHLHFLQRAADCFRQLGAVVHFVYGITYCDFVLRVTKRGKYAGLIHGFPIPIAGMCAFARDSKLKAIKSAYVGPYHWEDIGIAFDETDRQNQLSVKKRSILCSLRITEEQAKAICVQDDLLSPVYSRRSRDGCALCPNSTQAERDAWFAAYPGSREKLQALQLTVQEFRPDRNPLRGHQWFEV